MKETFTKFVVTFVAVLLALSFIGVALLVGLRAAANAEGWQDGLLLGALALCGAAASVVKNVGNSASGASGATVLRIAPHHRRKPRRAFINLLSRT